jgi:hypothetical protein
MRLTSLKNLLFDRALLVAGLCIVSTIFPMEGICGDWNPDPSLGNSEQHLRLYHIGRRWGDEHFDESVGLVEKDPGRHRNYLIRESAYYALGLLLTGDPADRSRAEKILQIVLTKQDLRKDKPTYGSFLPYNDDKWETAVNPDLNYCQFVAMALGQIIDLDRKQHALSHDLLGQVEAAFKLAVDQTMRRDVDPGYTNISLLSAAVAAAGDKLFNIPGTRDFAMCKVSWILSRALPGSTLREYLAPTYFGADLDAAYELKEFADSPELKNAAERMITFFWHDIAAGYHAPTFQLAGPHSRAYGENMLEYAAGLKWFLYLAMDGKYPIADVERNHNWDCGGLTLMATLPVEVRSELNEKPVPWREVVVDRSTGMAFRQYREGDFILGSVNLQSLWQQQRSVVAYWPITQPSWNVGYCMDMSAQTFGNGYARYYSTQSKASVLAAITGKLPVPAKGGIRFGFNSGAQAAPLAGGPAGACVVHDGDVTTYIYPVTSNGGQFTFENGAEMTLVERPWASADPAGNYNMLAYLVTFQLPGQPVPVVKNLSVHVSEKGTTITAEVNGTSLSLEAAK